jgi:hypothetical protein
MYPIICRKEDCGGIFGNSFSERRIFVKIQEILKMFQLQLIKYYQIGNAL